MTGIKRIEIHHMLEVPDLWSAYLQAVLTIEKNADKIACPVCMTKWQILYERHVVNATVGCVVTYYETHHRLDVICCECLALDPEKIRARFREIAPDTNPDFSKRPTRH